MLSSKATSAFVGVHVCPLCREVASSMRVHVSELVHMCIFVVNPVANLKLVKLKVICVKKQRKKKGNVYLSLLTHILEICALRFYLLPWASCSFIAEADGVELQ